MSKRDDVTAHASDNQREGGREGEEKNREQCVCVCVCWGGGGAVRQEL